MMIKERIDLIKASLLLRSWIDIELLTIFIIFCFNLFFMFFGSIIAVVAAGHYAMNTRQIKWSAFFVLFFLVCVFLTVDFCGFLNV
jgi:hypothetical protein